MAIAAAFMAGAPIGAAAAAGGGGGSAGVGAAAASGQASNGSGYEPSETDCVNVAQQPGRYRAGRSVGLRPHPAADRRLR